MATRGVQRLKMMGAQQHQPQRETVEERTARYRALRERMREPREMPQREPEQEERGGGATKDD